LLLIFGKGKEKGKKIRFETGPASLNILILKHTSGLGKVSLQKKILLDFILS
jgi:hypothetical protein